MRVLLLILLPFTTLCQQQNGQSFISTGSTSFAWSTNTLSNVTDISTCSTAKTNTLYISDTQIASISSATNERIFTNGSLNIAVNAGDYIEIKCVNPTWATNPLTFIAGGYIYIE